MVYVMTLSERASGSDAAETTFGGRSFRAVSRNGATMALARDLMEAGAPDGPVEARGPDGRLRFTSRSLHRLAKHTISETDRGLVLAKWRPFDAAVREAA